MEPVPSRNPVASGLYYKNMALVIIIARCNDESRSGFYLTLFTSRTFLNSTKYQPLRIEKPDLEIEGEEPFPK